ncbi:MAG: hypothetical protein ACTSU3_06400 [Candidatus Thorarchaeota archaeon]
MKPIRVSELRILEKVARTPSLNKSDLASTFGVTRSAVTQLWKRLESEKDFQIRGIINYLSLGLKGIFGWVEASVSSKELEQFSNWLQSNKYVHSVTESSITSKMSFIVTFLAVVPFGSKYYQFTNQLERFQKRPYSLKVIHGDLSRCVNSLNFGLFDGQVWNFESKFKFGATLDAARGYAEILPATMISNLGKYTPRTFQDLVIAFALRENYQVTAGRIIQLLESLGEIPPSSRTVRRRLALLRGTISTPYVYINDIGLSNRVTICIEENQNQSHLLRVFHAQATTFPSSHIMASENLMLLDVDVPTSSDYLSIAQNLSQIASSGINICTFIAKKSPQETSIERILQNLK